MIKLDTSELEKKANLIRQDIIRMLVKAGSGHSAGPLGMADIFTAFYFHILNQARLGGARPPVSVKWPHLPGSLCRYGCRRVFSP